MTPDHIGDALRKRGLKDYVLGASFAAAVEKPEVVMAIKDALKAWIRDEKLKGVGDADKRTD